jgi:predicted membrane channel-forming protein YqfA (hemolysin III family)
MGARAAAGTYTPLCLVGLAPPVRERLLATVWGGAALGMLQARPPG